MSLLPQTWITKAGEEIQIEDMTDDHLRNARAMLERKQLESRQTLEEAWPAMLSFRGDMAQYYANQDIERLEAYSFRVSSFIDAFSAELKRRGLE